MPVDRETGRPRGFAFVEFAERTVAEQVIDKFNAQPFMGRNLAVSEARAREDRPPGTRPPGGGFGGPRPGGPGASPGGAGGYAPRPSGWAPRPDSGGAPGGSRNRNFGPDAPPKNKRKAPRKDSERGPKGPIKERPVSRLYENDEDWRNPKEDDLGIDDIATSAKAKEDDETVDEE